MNYIFKEDEENNMNTGDKMFFTCCRKKQTITLAMGVYKFECWGATGGSRGGGSPSFGGYSSGVLSVYSKTDFNVYVGQNGSSGGWNGGGSGPSSGNRGGGATDVRIGGDSLYNRFIVAGGGGGGGSPSYNGGYGGGLTGGSNRGGCGSGGIGGTQNSGGSNNGVFGYGGSGYSGSNGYGGGGGGGWFGGGGVTPDCSYDDDKGGGGGSGYVYTKESFKPVGYLVDMHYLIDTVLLSGDDKNIPSPSKDDFIKLGTDGLCVITCISTIDYLFIRHLNSFYMPYIEYYDKNTQEFIPNGIVEIVKDYNENKSGTKLNKKLNEKIITENEEFYPYEKFSNFDICYPSSDKNEIITIKFNQKKWLRDKSIIEIRDILLPKDNHTYVIDLDNTMINFAIKIKEKLYGKDFKEIKMTEINDKGFTGGTLVDVSDNDFSLFCVFNDTPKNEDEYFKGFKVLQRDNKELVLLSNEDYTVYENIEKRKVYIKFHKDFKKVYVNKTNNGESMLTINTMEEFK